jgi:hypothetical protein
MQLQGGEGAEGTMAVDSLRNILRKSMLKRIERNVESQQWGTLG